MQRYKLAIKPPNLFEYFQYPHCKTTIRLSELATPEIPTFKINKQLTNSQFIHGTELLTFC